MAGVDLDRLVGPLDDGPRRFGRCAPVAEKEDILLDRAEEGGGEASVGQRDLFSVNIA